MKKRTMRWASAGLVLSLFLASLSFVPSGSGNASAATSKSMAALYAQIQNERAAKVVALVNKERAAAGLKPLTVHTNLSKMAKDKAIDMFKNKYFSHTSPLYGSPFDMMDAYNITYRYAGENIAKGQKSAEEVVEDWMNSPGHKANMMNANYNLIGVGYYNGYWVQEFIGK
ncbi:putative YkwD family protein [Fontibacillus solani]|uniref:Putative YkwD family protein n=1 Tax=Fontibacillus solani TaxID=1572857 RepID=A0A7W3SSC5_9BACL|nr:CAP domain-containing protein [Fontibacillus solani]MBA9085267.1 putative YkwD family protein [Fontibacillus solani]